MLRRLLPAFIALGIGLVALGWGLVTLQGLFAEEDALARARLRQRRHEISAKATIATQDRLRSNLELRSFDLHPSSTFFWVHDGVQRSPGRDRPKPITDAPLREAYEQPSHKTQSELLSGLISAERGDDSSLTPAALQALLLARVAQISQRDFEFLVERISVLTAQRGLPLQPFLNAVHELEFGSPILPMQVFEPTLVNRTWYLEPDARTGDTRGVDVPLDQVLREVETLLRAQGLMTDEDHVGATVRPIQRVKSLVVEAELPAITRAEAELARRYGLKNSMIVVCGLLAIALVVIAILGQHRKQRFLDLKSDFIATVSHELRTPLASIRLLAETLERQREGLDQQTQNFPGRIVRVADGLHFLVENILSFNQLTKSRWRVEPRVVSLEELINDLRTDLTDASARPVHLSVGGEEVSLWVDPTLARLIFANLGRNACSYNVQATVEISVEAQRQANGTVVIRFVDNGIGMPAHEWENVFHDFYRLKTVGSETHGSGLGLALCRRIMAMHHGSIAVESSDPLGTTFLLVFKLV